jgi:hypothetical protein
LKTNRQCILSFYQILAFTPQKDPSWPTVKQQLPIKPRPVLTKPSQGFIRGCARSSRTLSIPFVLEPETSRKQAAWPLDPQCSMSMCNCKLRHVTPSEWYPRSAKTCRRSFLCKITKKSTITINL